MFINFYEIDLEEEFTIDVKDINTIEEGIGCIIITNTDGSVFKTHKVYFTE